MKDALDGCVRNCNHYRGTGFVPSRLLDLGPQISLDSIRLVDSSQVVSSNGSHAPKYAALSYCWGSPLATDSIPHVCSTMQSLESMKLRVHEQTIPLTILDAIKVCKALSIRYLWVDSLCIIQDENADWERESLSMTLIYQNAFVTICTPSSKSSNEGFLARRREHVAVPFRSRVVPSIYGQYNLVASGTYLCTRDWRQAEDLEVDWLFKWLSLDIDGTCWSSRGWTLQEFQMSNRVLIFGESMVHFSCRHAVQSENGSRKSFPPSRIIETLDSYSSETYPEIYYSEWESMLKNYGYRLFTVIEDKLPAISGMAKYIADETGDEYLAGLWKSQLPCSLVWQADCYQNVKYHIELPDLIGVLHSPKSYIAPSWSPVRLDTKVERGFSHYMWSKGRVKKSTVVDARVRSAGENPFGRVQSGRIRIRGLCTTVSSDLARLPCFSDAHLWYTLDEGVITYYHLDYFPRGNSCSQGKLSILLIERGGETCSLHHWGHDFSAEEARHCLTNHLPLHADYLGSSPDLKSTGVEGQAEQYSDRSESDSGSSHSRGLSVARSSKELETEMDMQPDPNSESSPDESESAHTGSSNDSEDTSDDNRDAFGLLVHTLPGTNDYVRVGVWASLVEDGGGTALCAEWEEREIDIV